MEYCSRSNRSSRSITEFAVRNGAAAVILKIFWYAPGLKSTHVLTKTATLLINYTVRTDNINNLKNLNHVLISNIEIYINMVRRREKITKNSPGTIWPKNIKGTFLQCALIILDYNSFFTYRPIHGINHGYIRNF